MDENKLRWITLAVIVGVGASYMLWLVISYLRFMETDKFVRSFLEERFPVQAEKGEPVSES